MTPPSNSYNMNFGKFDNWKELEEAKKNADYFKNKRIKFNEEGKWTIKKYCLRIKSWDLTLLITPVKLSMYSCRNIIIREHSIKILKIQYLKEITTYRHLYKCKINQCYLKFFKNVREIYSKRGRANTSILLLKTQQISTLSFVQIRVYYRVGKKRQLDIKIQEVKIFEKFNNINNSIILFFIFIFITKLINRRI